ncbi:protein D2-like isoform X2 [Homarus americanus]|nr:protein D2-like isoform X2 [Homarus americanus]XP_042232012.1 protein D2-like isoform X2 [Homarus americanus]KAG7176581.1 Phosphatidylethanolamine-binding protein 4-like [Homarus americanus]
MLCDSIKTLLLVVVVCSPVLATTCQLKKPTFGCSNLPKLTVDFEQVTIESCGNNHTKTLFSKLLAVSFDGLAERKTYALVMVDPDAPGSGEGEAYLHWLHTGVKGSGLAQGNITSGNTIMSYARPTPPSGTGVHRYIFYLYEESNKDITFQTISKRGKFNLHKYAQKNELCGPIAENMFTTQYNE